MRRRGAPGTLAACIAALLLLAACGRVAQGREQDIDGRRIRAVATTGMVADVVRHVGGDRVEVTGLMGPGVDPHLYKASERDVIALAEADVVFYSGLHLEAKMADVFAEMQGFGRTVALAERIPESSLLSPPGFQGTHDPHVWFDVSMWRRTIPVVRDALAELDPRHTALYRARAADYSRRLAALHRYVRRRAAEVPADRRVLVTAHDAFNYFGRAYGFEVVALQGISTAAETGTADVARIADLVARRRIPALFVETSVSPRFVQALQEAVESRGFDVDVGGSLYSDAMGTPGTPDGTYVGMVRHNIDTIVAGLAPEHAAGASGGPGP